MVQHAKCLPQKLFSSKIVYTHRQIDWLDHWSECL